MVVLPKIVRFVLTREEHRGLMAGPARAVFRRCGWWNRPVLDGPQIVESDALLPAEADAVLSMLGGVGRAEDASDEFVIGWTMAPRDLDSHGALHLAHGDGSRRYVAIPKAREAGHIGAYHEVGYTFHPVDPTVST